MLHLWSLSVEEQFYIVWPLVVGLAWKHTGRLRSIMLLLTALSFALSIKSVAAGHIDLAFYSPFSRAWELMIGAWLAVGSRRMGTSSVPPAVADALSLCGAVLIAAGIAFVRPTSAFPGWWALLPTVGAACLIAAGSAAWLNRSILSSPVMVFFGKISYPLYLWHWPLLAFPKIYYGFADRNHRIAAVAVSILFAWLTYRWVEQPIRHGRRRASTPIVLVGVSLGYAALAAMLMASDGWLGRLPAEMRDISRAEAAFDYGRYRHRICFLAPEQEADAFGIECNRVAGRPDRRLVLWGDSHAAALYPGLQALLLEYPTIELSQFTAAACPPVIGMSIAQRPHCRAINDNILARLTADPPATVILSANWTFYNGEYGWERLEPAAIAETASRLRQAGVGRVIIVGPFARWLIAEPLVLLREWRDEGAVPLRSMNSFNLNSFGWNTALRAVAASAGAEYVSPISRLCADAGCLQTVTKEGRRYPIAWDDAHLTIPASEQFAREWFESLLPREDPGGRPAALR